MDHLPVEHVVAGHDALVLMPTGGGKSLCYQIPALCRPGVAVVISPLIALMRDQVEALKQLGVAAAALNSSMSFGEAAGVERAIRNGRLDLVYVAPERLLSESFQLLLHDANIALFAIDEAHCARASRRCGPRSRSAATGRRASCAARWGSSG